jgi:hypothetical protein
VYLEARWNAVAQAVHVGTAAASDHHTPPVWKRDTEASAESTVVADFVVTDVEPQLIRELLMDALAKAAMAPHAWAGGPYIAGGGDLVLTARGSVGEGRLDYAWDLDGDGEYETAARGPSLSVPVGTVESGWVGVRVTAAGGGASTALAWVSASSQGAMATTSCVIDGAAPSSGAGRPGCGTTPAVGLERQIDVAPTSLPPAVKERGNARAAFGDGAQAALTLVPAFADPRVTTIGGHRSEVATRAGDRTRRRPGELVLRERGLRALLGRSLVT